MSATSSEARTASAGGCDLSGPEHAELVERAGHGAYRSGRDLGVEGGVLQLRVPERSRAIMRIFYVIETVSSAGLDLMLAIAATLSERYARRCPPT
jgi:hypothetical protein